MIFGHTLEEFTKMCKKLVDAIIKEGGNLHPALCLVNQSTNASSTNQAYLGPFLAALLSPATDREEYSPETDFEESPIAV